jgi:ubiquinone biosynthesis accessory factor UbiJ
MATPSPFAFLEQLVERVGSSLQPPVWLVDEVQHRAILFVNHVLMQESEATSRLSRQKGRVVHVQWRSYAIKLVATPAGLVDRASSAAVADLTLTVTDESPFSLAQAALRGDKPGVRIEGDVQLAAEINWLVDNVRWDAEEDLARVLGDAPAHALGDAVRRLADGLRLFLSTRQAPADAGGSGAAGAGSAPATGFGPVPSTGFGQSPPAGSAQAPSTGSGQAPSAGSGQASA